MTPTGADPAPADPAPADPAPADLAPADLAPGTSPTSDLATAEGTAPNAHRFGPLPEEVRRRWAKFCDWDDEYFPNHIGMVVEDLRRDYARLRLPWQQILRQREGVMHGGLITALVDTCVVPAIATHYEVQPAHGHRESRRAVPAVRHGARHRGRGLGGAPGTQHGVLPRRGAQRRPGGEVELVASADLVFRVSASPSTAPMGGPD